MRLAPHYVMETRPRPVRGACQAWERQLSLLDWARLCRVRSLLTHAPWELADAEGLVLTYAWSLHEWRHRLARPDPLEWALAVMDLERTRDSSFMSSLAKDGWDLGEYVVTLRGAIQLLARFGQGRRWYEDCWSCEDCVCRLCGAPVEYPFTMCVDKRPCVARIQQRRQAAWDDATEEDDDA